MGLVGGAAESRCRAGKGSEMSRVRGSQLSWGDGVSMSETLDAGSVLRLEQLRNGVRGGWRGKSYEGWHGLLLGRGCGLNEVLKDG